MDPSGDAYLNEYGHVDVEDSSDEDDEVFRIMHHEDLDNEVWNIPMPSLIGHGYSVQDSPSSDVNTLSRINSLVQVDGCDYRRNAELRDSQYCTISPTQLGSITSFDHHKQAKDFNAQSSEEFCREGLMDNYSSTVQGKDAFFQHKVPVMSKTLRRALQHIEHDHGYAKWEKDVSDRGHGINRPKYNSLKPHFHKNRKCIITNKDPFIFTKKKRSLPLHHKTSQSCTGSCYAKSYKENLRAKSPGVVRIDCQCDKRENFAHGQVCVNIEISSPSCRISPATSNLAVTVGPDHTSRCTNMLTKNNFQCTQCRVKTSHCTPKCSSRVFASLYCNPYVRMDDLLQIYANCTCCCQGVCMCEKHKYM